MKNKLSDYVVPEVGNDPEIVELDSTLKKRESLASRLKKLARRYQLLSEGFFALARSRLDVRFGSRIAHVPSMGLFTLDCPYFGVKSVVEVKRGRMLDRYVEDEQYSNIPVYKDTEHVCATDTIGFFDARNKFTALTEQRLLDLMRDWFYLGEAHERFTKEADGQSLSIVAGFPGRLSKNVRMAVQIAKKEFGDKLYILVDLEVMDWVSGEMFANPRFKMAGRKADAILVGFKYNRFWVLSSFKTEAD